MFDRVSTPIVAFDPDRAQTLRYQVVGGAGAALFGIDPIRGELFLKTKAGSLDYETVQSYEVRVRVTDDGLPTPKSAEGTYVVTVEDVNEPPYRLDRLLTQLTQSGAFDGVVGFAVGQLTSCGDEPEAALDTVCGNLRCLDVPIVAGLPLGHEPCSQAVVLGATVTLDPAARTVSR